MESCTWSFCVPVYPINFTQLTRSLLQHVTSYVNKFVPDLKGILVDYDARSLQVITEVDYSDRTVPTGFTCCRFVIHPELNYLLVHGKIKVSVFCPYLGLEVDAIVSMVRPQFILCRTEISNVMISLPRLSAESVMKKEEFDFKMLKPFDKIRVKLTQVDISFGSSILQGELIKCLSQPLLKYFKAQHKHQAHSACINSSSGKAIKVSDDTTNSQTATSVHEDSSNAVACAHNLSNVTTPKAKKSKIQKLDVSFQEVVGDYTESLLTNKNTSANSRNKSHRENSVSKVLKEEDNLDSEEFIPALLNEALLQCGRKYKSSHQLPSATVKEEPT
uniref:SJCHGC05818 protein n=1 Tax=Schistosoma japonicum TaxID=6182 RepID=Q5DDZ9_SCHJA|nr:SJCHGC05818 protein [Schistosoma japonicum]